MLAPIIRIATLIALSVGGWFMYPKIKPLLQPILANPQVLGEQTIAPVIDKVNTLLPENIQIPTPTPIPSSDDPTLEGSSPDNSPAPTSAILKNIVDEVKQRAGEAAQSQIDSVKKETGNAFCAALIETIKKQCGVQ